MDDDGVLLLQQFDVQNVEQGHDVRLELHLTRQRLVASAYVYNLSTDERTRIDVLDARRILSANTEFESMQTRAAEWTLTEAAYKGGLVERVPGSSEPKEGAPAFSPPAAGLVESAGMDPENVSAQQ